MDRTESLWRVSIATLNRVLVEPQPGAAPLLALERKATLVDGIPRVYAQPFGGAARIHDPAALEQAAGPLRYDSDRSRAEKDARFLISPDRWPAVKALCLRHLSKEESPLLETSPHRELAEEFHDALQIALLPEQYMIRPLGFVIENTPAATNNVYARGYPTVRIYRIFETRITAPFLRAALLQNNERYSDLALQELSHIDAANGGKGRSNAALLLPLTQVLEAYMALPPARRYARLVVSGHELDPSAAAILPVTVPQFERIA